jgi:predicted metal-dependent peptidase
MTTKPVMSKEEIEALLEVIQNPKNLTPEISRTQDNRVQNSILTLNSKTYIGSILQCMRIIPEVACTTACVSYDKTLKTIRMMYNPIWFNLLPDESVRFVLIHEIEHVMRKHLIRGDKVKYKDDKQLLNVAMDITLNQGITDIGTLKVVGPELGCYVENFYLEDGTPFPLGKTFEEYYDLLQKPHSHKDKYGNESKSGDGENQQTVDKHEWAEGEVDDKDMIEAMSDLLKRANNLHEKTHSTKSGQISDYLQELLKTYTNLNYKEILAMALKSSIAGTDIKKTWTRPSRRFGLAAKGNKIKPNPSVAIWGDTSGSIGYAELNEQFNIIGDIFKHGVRRIDLSLFHTQVYHTQQFKKGETFDKDKLQSGGTCLQDVMDKINKIDADLNVIITDGYYCRPNLPKNLDKTIIFLIRNDNNLNHPLKDIGKTLPYKVSNG